MLINSIFYNLINTNSYTRIVHPFLKSDYFDNKHDKYLFKVYSYLTTKYNKIPSLSDMKLFIDRDTKICVEDTQEIFKKIEEISKAKSDLSEELLVDQTEQWVKDRAVEIAVNDFIATLEKGGNRFEAEEKIQEALSIQFKVEIGHDYFEDSEKRLEYYHNEESKIPLDIDVLNEALGGGLVKKTMTLIVGNTNSGKSIVACHCANSLLMSGKNVLIISGEMIDFEVLKRQDAALLDISISDLNTKLDKDTFNSKIKGLMNKHHGKLIVKHYPTGYANTNHIRNLINELRLKKNFIPDVVILDGLTNFASAKVSINQVGSTNFIKSVGEEQRGLAVDLDYALLTLCQFNRMAKSKNEKADLEDIGESYAIVQCADSAISLIQTDELREQNKYLIKLMKTRFTSCKGKIFTMGISYDKMRLINLDKEDQEIPLHLRDAIEYNNKINNKKEENIALFDFD